MTHVNFQREIARERARGGRVHPSVCIFKQQNPPTEIYCNPLCQLSVVPRSGK